jgi:hypothetical protein
MPQIDFQKFSGTNPKLWIRQCDTYFDLYHVPVQNWVKLATVNFTGPTEFGCKLSKLMSGSVVGKSFATW